MKNPTLIDIIKIYTKIKQMIIIAENIDENNRLPLNSVNELRNAFDHLMRVLGKENNIDGFNSIDIELNLQQTIEHIYRAGYDACDIIAINLYEQIDKMLSPYSSDTIVKVMPNYYSEIKPNLEKLYKQIQNEKIKKGIDEDSFASTYFDGYDSLISKVQDVKLEIEHKMSTLEKLQNKDSEIEKQSKRNYYITLFIGIISLAVALLSLN
jgi:hypothetical protein